MKIHKLTLVDTPPVSDARKDAQKFDCRGKLILLDGHVYEVSSKKLHPFTFLERLQKLWLAFVNFIYRQEYKKLLKESWSGVYNVRYAIKMPSEPTQLFSFPQIDEINNLSAEDIHRIWARNQDLLLGILASTKIPLVGFHGTGEAGIEFIQNTKQSASYKGLYDFIWVAGVKGPTDPITYLADLYVAANKARNYSSERGGIYVVDTQAADPLLYKTIRSPAVDYVRQDAPNQKRFIDLVGRTWGERPREIGYNAGQLITTQKVDLAFEMLLKFNPENFSERVIGLISMQTLYLEDWCDCSYGKEKDALLDRLRLQMIIFKALEVLKILPMTKIDESAACHEKGRNILEKLDNVTKTSIQELQKLKLSNDQLKV